MSTSAPARPGRHIMRKPGDIPPPSPAFCRPMCRPGLAQPRKNRLSTAQKRSAASLSETALRSHFRLLATLRRCYLCCLCFLFFSPCLILTVKTARYCEASETERRKDISWTSGTITTIKPTSLKMSYASLTVTVSTVPICAMKNWHSFGKSTV